LVTLKGSRRMRQALTRSYSRNSYSSEDTSAADSWIDRGGQRVRQRRVRRGERAEG
jgi:hypothetical protein